MFYAIGMFFVLQVSAGLLFKFGSLHKEYWTACCIAGNVFGITSTWFLMMVYRHLNPNVSEAICRGGYFVLIQLSFFLIYNSRLNMIQWGGIVIIIAGILLVSLCRESAGSHITEDMSSRTGSEPVISLE